MQILISLFLLCTSSYSQLVSIGNTTPDFSFQPTGEVVQITKLSKTKNQSDAEECFLFSFLNYWETAQFNRQGYELSPISAPYLTARKFQMYIDDMLTHGYSNFSLEGGLTQDLFAIMSRYGVVAEESWKPKKTWRYWDFSPMYKNIKDSIKKWQKILLQTEKSFGKNSVEYVATLTQAKEQTFRFVTELSGELPHTVTFQGKTKTTHEMLAYYHLEQGLFIQWMYSASRWHQDNVSFVRNQLISYTRATDSKFRTYPGRWAEILDTIIENLNRGEPTLIGFAWERGAGHMFTIIGYQVLDGKVSHLQFQNSWGSSWGINGTGWVKTGELAQRTDEIWWIE